MTSRPPKQHDLKTAEPFWSDVASGRKPFEVRVNDRDYRVGDTLALRSLESGAVCVVLVSYLIDGPPYLPPGLCVMGIAPIASDLPAQPDPDCEGCRGAGKRAYPGDKGWEWCDCVTDRRIARIQPLSAERIDVLASRAGGRSVGAPATRDEERAMALEIQRSRKIAEEVRALLSAVLDGSHLDTAPSDVEDTAYRIRWSLSSEAERRRLDPAYRGGA